MNSNRKKIFIINENEEDISRIREAFQSKQESYYLHTAASIKEAVMNLKDAQPDILITPLNLQSGTTLEFIRGIEKSISYPVLLVTEDERHTPESLQISAAGCLMKSKELYDCLPYIVEKTLADWNHVAESRKLREELKKANDEFELKISDRTSELVRLNSQLRESEGRFRMIAESIADILWTMDMSLNITYCNPSVKELLGYTCQEMINRPMDDIFTFASLNRVIEVFTKVLQNIDSMPRDLLIANVMELEMKSRDGAIIPVEITATLIRDDSGNPVAIHGLAHDITERKKADDLLRERNEHFHALFENSSSVMLLLNPKTGEIFDANFAACNFYGYPKTTLVNMNMSDINILPPEQIQMDMESAMMKRKNNFHMRHRLSSDTVRDVEVFSGPIKVSGRELLYSIVNDITERKKSENELKQLKEHYEYLIRISPTPTFTVDRDLHVTNWNEKAEEVTGYRYDEVIGKMCSTFAKCTFIDDCGLLSSGEPKKIKDKECQIKTKDGRFLTIIKNAHVIRDSNSKTIGIIESFTDITSLKETKKMLNETLLERELMLKEIHNWVKNNMQLMSNLLSLQCEHVTDEGMRALITKSISRIESMALIHEELYKSENISQITFADYIDQLLTYLAYAYDKKKYVKFDVDARGIVLGIDVAIPCALIINEIVTYSLRHSFPGEKKGKIHIKFKKTVNGKHSIEISDNGTGFDSDLGPWTEESLGFRLINSIVTQLKGELKMDLKKGTNFQILF